jgi:hypothetical protein
VPRSLESVIRSRVKFWQKRLLLSDWKITVVVGVADDGSTANCDASPEYRQAKLTFDPERMPTDLAETTVTDLERAILNITRRK